MKSIKRITYSIVCGLSLVLAFIIFGRAIRQYALMLTGHQKLAEDMPINSDIYNLDTSDIITKEFLK